MEQKRHDQEQEKITKNKKIVELILWNKRNKSSRTKEQILHDKGTTHNTLGDKKEHRGEQRKNNQK
jgi:hypothetical protein